MGMRDESWCNSCGTSIPYTDKEDYEAYCGECAEAYAQETPQKLIQLIEYMKLHLISLDQDANSVQKEMDEFEEMESNEYHALEIEHISLNGQWIGVNHLLSVANDILSSSIGKE